MDTINANSTKKRYNDKYGINMAKIVTMWSIRGEYSNSNTIIISSLARMVGKEKHGTTIQDKSSILGKQVNGA